MILGTLETLLNAECKIFKNFLNNKKKGFRVNPCLDYQSWKRSKLYTSYQLINRYVLTIKIVFSKFCCDKVFLKNIKLSMNSIC